MLTFEYTDYKKLRLVDIIVTCTDGYKQQINKLTKKKCYKIYHAFNVPNKKYENFKNRAIDISFIDHYILDLGYI